jgi:hypothetical protein
MATPLLETQASLFVSRHGFAGEGVRVAILDTGVDPGVPNLQRTPSGLPKIIEVVDATGSGDVQMRGRVRSLDGGKTVRGASGRVLTLNPSWPAPLGGEYRVGVKNALELFPRELAARMKRERLEGERTVLLVPRAGVGEFHREHQPVALEIHVRQLMLDPVLLLCKVLRQCGVHELGLLLKSGGQRGVVLVHECAGVVACGDGKASINPRLHRSIHQSM